MSSPPKIYEIFADEAWTQNSIPLRRYWCFLGGIFGEQAELDRLDKILKAVKAKHGNHSEAKWGKITADRLPCFMEMVDCFARFVTEHNIKYRQLFYDRSYVHADTYQTAPGNLYGLEVQFKLYYQFIKHSFGLQHLPLQKDGAIVYLRLDDHSNQKHKDNLVRFVQDLPRIFNRPDLKFKVSFINSAMTERIQICDLLMGAAGSHGNKMQSIRENGRRGMSPKQKVRESFCTHVYNHLRAISCGERGTRAFNWFETTGRINVEDSFNHKIRIWKFIPKIYYKDKGWENSQLTRDGLYRGADIDFNPVSLQAIDDQD